MMQAHLRGAAKRAEIKEILQVLENDTPGVQSSSESRITSLQRLKLLGSSAQDADPLYQQKAIDTLALVSINSTSIDASKEALRCLANALLLEPLTRQKLVDSGKVNDITKFLKHEELEVQGICSRILFLLTYDTNLDLGEFAQQPDVVEGINGVLARVQSITEKRRDTHENLERSPVEALAMSESLKLLFTITYHRPEISRLYQPSAKPMLEMIRIGATQKNTEPPLDPPMSHLINAIMNLDTENGITRVVLFPQEDQTCYMKCFIDILENSVNRYKPEELNVTALPLMMLIRTHLQYAPEQVANFLKSRLLPSDAERNKPLGRSDTLAGKLLHVTTSALASNIRESILSLMFELSGKNVDEFVKNVGYGHASGFLVNNNLPVPHQGVSHSDSASLFFRLHIRVDEVLANGETTEDINFVTGQYVVDEPPVKEPAMTEEEKLREAERLFVLFERLKKTGVVDVENPVETAARSGRFEELE